MCKRKLRLLSEANWIVAVEIYYKRMMKSSKTVMASGMFMDDGGSSDEGNADGEKRRLPTADLIFSEVTIKKYHRRSFNRSERRNNGSSRKLNDDNEIDHQSYRESKLKKVDTENDVNENSQMEKFGWLIVKHWLTVQSHEKVELASKRQWKRFWACLKDTNLQLYNNSSDINPKLTLSIINSLCYPLPEHPRRYHVFSLTLRTGETYCFQSLDQSEINHWIRCIHSHCLLNINESYLISNIKRLEESFLYEKKILKLAQLQLQLSTNEKIRLLISKQIQSWETNLESFHIDLFRNRCYLSSFTKNQNLPNSKELLLQALPTTKVMLFKLGAFTPCGFYACITARRRLDRRNSKLVNRQQMTSSSSVNNRIITYGLSPDVRTIVSINKTATVGELLKRVTKKLDLPIDDYFLYFNSTFSDRFVPNQNEKLNKLTYSSIDLSQKISYQIKLNKRIDLSQIEIYRDYSSKIFVSNVTKGSEGERLGIIQGDEVVSINNFNIKDLDSTTFNECLNQIPIMLTLRSLRSNRTANVSNATDQNSTCPKENNQLSPIFAVTVDELNEFSRSTTPILNTQRLQKVIFELIETEKSYVQDIQSLLKKYIEPLRANPKMLPSDIIESLYLSVKSMHQFQLTFLQRLESSLLTENTLISIAETFISYSKDFKHYSTYCAIHLRMNRLFHTHENNEYLKEFLSECNPDHQHSLSFESYLIKPVQRIFKYPLFLQQMFIYSDRNENNQIFSLEESKIKKALKMMNKISKYINSMQQLYEDFGQSFEYFIKIYNEEYNKTFKLNLPDLYAYGEIDWINIHRFLLCGQNYQCLRTFCFVFRNGCLLVVREQLNMKKQSFMSSHTMTENVTDRLIRFLPMKELKVELIVDTNTEHNYIWQLIQTDPTTHLKTYFRFANKDAHTYVKAINNCISMINRRLNEDIRISQLSYSLRKSSNQQQLSSSHSCYDLLTSYSSLNKNIPSNHPRSPSPIWKRRTTSGNKRPLSMTNNKNFS